MVAFVEKRVKERLSTLAAGENNTVENEEDNEGIGSIVID